MSDRSLIVKQVQPLSVRPIPRQIALFDLTQREAVAIMREACARALAKVELSSRHGLTIVAVCIIEILPSWVDQRREKVKATARVQRVERTIWLSVLEPGGTRRCPSSSLELLLRVFSQFVYSFSLHFDRPDGFRLQSAKHLDDIVCDVLAGS